MLVLGIESATPLASAALADEKGLLGEILLNVGLTHSEQLLPMIDSLLRQCRRTVRDIAAIGVSAGPGSFTGLRIGMATAKGLAQGLSSATGAADGAAPGEISGAADDAAAGEISGAANGAAPRGRVPVVAVPTLEAMAWQVAGQPVLVSPMLNARREQVYAGLYRWRAVRAEPRMGAGTTTGADTGMGTTMGADTGMGTDANTGSGAGVGAETETVRQALMEVFASRQRGKKERMDAGMGAGIGAGMGAGTGEGACLWRLDCLISPEAVSPETWAAHVADCLAGSPQKLPLYLLGDGAAMYREIWARDLAESVILPPLAGLCRGSFVALAAMDKLHGSEEAAQETQDAQKTQDAQEAQQKREERDTQEFYRMKPIYLRGI